MTWSVSVGPDILLKPAAPPGAGRQPRTLNNSDVLLYDRKGAAAVLSLSVRAIDYYVQQGELKTRRAGRRVLIPRGELVRFSRSDHPGPIAGINHDDHKEAA